MMKVPIKYRSGYRHQLVNTVTVQMPEQLWPDEMVEIDFVRLDAAGTLTIDEKYAWDGASGPTLDVPARQIVVPSLIHDVLCQLQRADKLQSVKDARKHIDQLFYQLLRERGMNLIRSRLWYRGVRLGSIMNGTNKPIKESS